MRKLLTITFLTIIISAMAQVPQGIPHQAVVRNQAGQPVVNSTVGVRISVLPDSVNADPVYSEIHYPATNSNGLITVVIGQGLPAENMLFENINWAAGPHFLKLEIDAGGGNNFSPYSTTQLMSVPYAYFTRNIAYIDPDASQHGDVLMYDSLSARYQPVSSGIIDFDKPLEIEPLAALRGQRLSVSFSAGSGLTFAEDAVSCPHVFADVKLQLTQDTSTFSIYPFGRHYISEKRFDAVFDIPATAPAGLYEIVAGPATPCEFTANTFFSIRGMLIVNTEAATNITSNSAMSGGNITNDGAPPVTARGVVWSSLPHPTLSNNEGITTDGTGTGYFTSNLTGLTHNTVYYLRAYATNSLGTAYGGELSFRTTKGPPCPGMPTVTDIDGNVYNTVLIGNQCWMKENLRVTKYNNGDAIPTGLSNADWGNTTSGAYAIYDNDDDMLQDYGNLYNWYAVDDARGICPEGWSVPSDADWTELVNYVVSQGFPNSNVVNGAGNAFKSCRQVGSPLEGCNTSEHPRWDSHSTHYGFDEFGFSALPGGYRSTSGSFINLGTDGYWWSSTEISSTSARYSRMYHSRGNVNRSSFTKANGFSVRCIPTYNLNLDVSPAEAGTVTGAGLYQAGQQVNITVEANPGWQFISWTGDTEHVANPTSANTTVTMPADNVTLTATFEEREIIYGDGVTDIDGNDYITVIFGNQEWMAENLRVTRDASGNNITRFCYDNNTTNCELYGGLYTWHTIMNGLSSSSSNPSGVQGICPTGWHVPSDAEWTELLNYVVSQGYPNNYWNEPNGAGNALKSCRQVGSPLEGCNTSEHPRWNSHNTHYGFDEFGFSGLPGGQHGSDWIFLDIGNSGSWWSSTEDSSTDSWHRGMRRFGDVLRLRGNKSASFSLRCVRDGDGPTYNLNIDVSPAEAGTLTGAGQYQAGQQLSITAVANPGWQFINWTGDTEHVANPASANTTVTMPALSVTLIANFEESNLNLDVSPAEAGTVTGAGYYEAGQQVNITAVSNPGWQFINWTGDTEHVANPASANTTVTIPADNVTLTAIFEERGIYGDGVTDIDGNDYITVIIGNQEWMAENLRVTRDASGNNITRYCYGNNTTNCELYGGLYTWHTVMNGQSSSSTNPSGVQGICPTGWHVPSDAEWTELLNYLDSQGFPNSNVTGGAGNALKSCRQVGSPLEGCNTLEHPRWNSHSTRYGFDEFGFSALPGSFRRANMSFGNLGTGGYWWSSTEHSSSNAWRRTMTHSTGDVDRNNSTKTIGFSLRCVRDEPTYNLNLDVSPAEAGTVTGAGQYKAGHQVNITATANPGWQFINWTGDTEHVANPASANTTVNMPADNVTLTAVFEEREIIYGDGVTDIDGNDYITVIIGNQEWMAENLRVTKYNNGNAIPTGLSNTAWSNTTSGAYAIYPHGSIDGLNSNAEVVAAYGKLYNWYAVDDSRGICPEGWSVPSDADWTALVNYVVSEGFPNSNVTNGAGNALKSCRQVNSPLDGECNTSTHPRWNSHSTRYGFDEFGFSALPGGYRNSNNGSFDYLGARGYWWSSTEGSSTRAWRRRMAHHYGSVGRANYNKPFGFSLRCVRD